MATGFADLHNHQFANLGFGGLAFWGSPMGDPAYALQWCTPAHGLGGVGDILGGIVKGSLDGGWIPGHLVGGNPQFDGWPRWNSVTHQAVYEDWLFRAVQGGLRLLVMHAVNSEFLASQANRLPGRSPNDMEAVDLQIREARAMEAHIDAKSGGSGQGWYRIVHTPDEAQAVVDQGKLAVVLGIEVDFPFDCRRADYGTDRLEAALDKYYALGVRHLYPIHFADNGFGGASFDKPLQWALDAGVPTIYSPLNPVGTIPAYSMQTESASQFGYEYRTGRRNRQGLTELGKALIRMMIDRGMIIDVDHMSARSKADTFDICESAGYPVVSSHTGFVELSKGGKRHEGQLLPAEIERIRALGGMVAVIVRQGRLDEIGTAEWPGHTTVPHTSGNTSQTLLQAYLYAAWKMQGGPVGFGSDFNGFAGLPGPRFGPEASPGGKAGPPPTNPMAYPFTAAATGLPMNRSVVGRKTFDFNSDGLAHVGMLPDLIADFQAMGVTTAELQPLLRSAQGYISTWEKAWVKRPKPTPEPFRPVFAEGAPGKGIGGFDLASTADRAFAFDFTSSGKLDHLVLYRPGTRTCWILKNIGGSFSPVYAEGAVGIGGYDLAHPGDVSFAFDFKGSGKLDHLVLYRPGHGTMWILKNTRGSFTPVYAEGAPGKGIGGYDLADPSDRAIAFDYTSSGRLDHLVLYRPGKRTCWILKNTKGAFSPVYTEGAKGIGGYDLADPRDRMFAFDYSGSGKLDHLVMYRPGARTCWILKNTNGAFSPVYAEGAKGIGGYDLADPNDAAFAFDYEGVGKSTYIVLYRPGQGTVWILKNTNGAFAPVFAEGAPGRGIGRYDLAHPGDRGFAFDFDHAGALNHLVMYRPGHGTVWVLERSS